MKPQSSETHAASVKTTYENWWSGVHDVVLQQKSSGECDLARFIHLTHAATVGATPPGERISILWRTKVPSPYLTSVRIVRDWIADTVIEHAQGCDAIIELGSGWGFNLFNIWLRGGPKSIPYHAFEYTEAGRNTTAAVRGAVSAGPDLHIHPFDYREPVVPLAADGHKRVLVYTSHSIEQVNRLPQSLFELLMGLAPEVKVLHFEPVGWQFRDEPGQAGGMDFGQRAYCERHRYNENLWEMLRNLESAGRIAIRRAEADMMGVKVYNSTSLIVWDKLK